MIKKVLLILCVFEFIAVSFAADKPSNSKVVAYYFHGNYRCPTCRKLEQYSREAIESNFKNELILGKLAFAAVNIDEKGNEHFMKDYQLYTKSLVISLVKGDKEIKSKNLVKIWEYVSNKQEFYSYVTEEIKKFLKEL
ncbi:MAG: nitrophenyl compound nitroreductase subunit ArsF family protein [Candidatus Omnitrophota bacterium]|jgi:hypothetical protein